MYPKKEWKLVSIEKSTRDGKKYKATIENKKSKKQVSIHFGSTAHQHYKDKKGLYSHLDHNDKERRKRFQNRFRSRYNPNEYSATYFSWAILW